MEFLIVLNADNTFRGAHVTDANGFPAPLSEVDLPELIAAANVSAMARAAELEAKLEVALNELDAIKSTASGAAQAARRIIADKKISDSDSCKQIDKIAADLLKDKQDRERDALRAKIAEAEAELAAFGI